MVTGGFNNGHMASTEVLPKDGSQWVYAGSLPSARYELKGATLGDKLIMTGEMMVIMVYMYLISYDNC